MENATIEESQILETPTPAATGTGPDSSGDQVSASIKRASANAVREHAAANPPKRGRGRPFGSVKKQPALPLEGMGAPTDPALGDAPLSPPQNPPAIDPQDEKAVEALVDGVLEGLSDFASGIQRIIASQKGATSAQVEEAAKAARMSDRAQNNMRIGGVALVKKYLQEYAQYTPEMAFGIPFLFWAGGNILAAKRPYEQQPQQPSKGVVL